MTRSEAARGTGAATDGPVPLTISVRSFARLGPGATAEGGAYVLIVAADLTAARSGVRATRYGVWGELGSSGPPAVRAIPPGLSPEAVDALANFAVLRRPFWGLDNRTPRPIARPADVLIVATLVGRDDDRTGATRARAQEVAATCLADSAGLARPARVGHLLAGLDAALGLPGGRARARELALTPADLLPRDGAHVRSLVVAHDSGRYRVDFEFLAG